MNGSKWCLPKPFCGVVRRSLGGGKPNDTDPGFGTGGASVGCRRVRGGIRFS